MLIDLHVHSSYTKDVNLALPDLVAQAKAAGLDGFCLTDVHTVRGGPEAKELALGSGIIALVGFEAYTDCGHFVVVVPEPATLPDIPSWVRTDSQGRLVYQSLVEAVHARDGILIAAHPFDRSIPESPGDALMGLDGVSAVEVLNASRPDLVNELAEEVAAGVGWPGVGGTDARTSLDALGRFATLVRGTIESEADLIDRIRTFDVWPVSIGQPAFRSLREPPRPREPGRRSHAPGARGGGRGDRRPISRRSSRSRPPRDGKDPGGKRPKGRGRRRSRSSRPPKPE